MRGWGAWFKLLLATGLVLIGVEGGWSQQIDPARGPIATQSCTTANALPRLTTASTTVAVLDCTPLTSDGTDVTLGTGQMLGPTGVAAPAFSFTDAATSGFARSTTTRTVWRHIGVNVIGVSGGSVTLSSGHVFGFAATTDGDAVADTTASRASAGIFLLANAAQWTTMAEPACAVGTRGTVIYVAGGAGAADTFRICTKDAADAYAYRALY